MNLRSVFGKGPDLPYWAEGFQSQELETFLSEVNDFFLKAEGSFQIDRAEGRIHWDAPNGGHVKVGLHNVAIDYLHLPVSERKPYLEEWLTRNLESFTKVRSTPLTRDDKRASLRLKISGPLKGFDFEPGNFRILAPNLFAVLCQDEDDNVLFKDFTKDPDLGSIDDLYDLALRNTMTSLGAGQGTLPIVAQTGPMTVFFDEECPYVNSVALGVDLIVPRPPEHGFVLSIPFRSTAVLLAVCRGITLEILSSLHKRTKEDFEESPYQVSPDLFWVNGGQFKVLELDGEAHPNLDELLALIETLA